VWVATGDGDNCSIGAGHWVHAIRYNMDMTVMVFDNATYGLTKNQTSPTSPQGLVTNTHPRGAWLPPINMIQATLGFANVSFVARTVDWNVLHLHQTLKAAYDHKGLSFVQILQRCPTYTPDVFTGVQNNPDRILLLEHENGVVVDDAVGRMYKNKTTHDPSNIHMGRELAEDSEKMAIGLFYRNPSAPLYEEFTTDGIHMSLDEKLVALNQELDRFAI